MNINNVKRLILISVISVTAFGNYALCINFSDITLVSNVPGTGVGNGVAFADYDNDGNLDIYSSSDPNDIIYQNKGNGTFEDVTAKLGIEFVGDGVGVAFGDYDNDGDPDLYIPVNDGPDVFFQNESGQLFRDITRASRIENFGRARSASFVDFDLDGLLDIFVVNEGSSNILYRNRDGKLFNDVTNRMGLTGIGPGRSGVWGDYDNDGDMDLYIAYKGMENKLYRNDITSFHDATEFAGVGSPIESTGSVFADCDNDGWLDILTGDSRACVIYHNNGNGTFDDVAEISGVTNPGEMCTPSLADFDNDGDLDIYLSVWEGKSLLYENNGDGTFMDITEQAGIAALGNAWSACLGDIDNDGDIDIYTSFTTGNNVLYENQGNENNWLLIKAIGSLSNTNAIGVRIKAEANGILQIREISGATGYGSQDSYMVEFGFGKAEVLDSLQISWPSGIEIIMRDVKLNQTIMIEEGFSDVKESNKEHPIMPESNANEYKTMLMQNYPNPFNPETWIPISIADAGEVSISIYNCAGKLVRKLDAGYRNSGIYAKKSDCIFWDGKNENGEPVVSGIYFYQLNINGTTDTKKMILAK